MAAGTAKHSGIEGPAGPVRGTGDGFAAGIKSSGKGADQPGLNDCSGIIGQDDCGITTGAGSGGSGDRRPH